MLQTTKVGRISDPVFGQEAPGLNAAALEMLNSTPVCIKDPVFGEAAAERRRVTFVCSPPGTPVQGKRKLGGTVVTPEAHPRKWEREGAPPPLDLDAPQGRGKRVKFYSSLSAVREEAPACPRCGGAQVPCQGHAFERSEMDYFEPCEGAVCLACDAPRCETCEAPVAALPFCKACVEMVSYEAGSYVADNRAYAKYLCKGGGDDCQCNVVVCDKCHASTDHVAHLGPAVAAAAHDDDVLKYLVQEPITEDTRLCDDCCQRLHVATTSDE